MLEICLKSLNCYQMSPLKRPSQFVSALSFSFDYWSLYPRYLGRFQQLILSQTWEKIRNSSIVEKTLFWMINTPWGYVIYTIVGDVVRSIHESYFNTEWARYCVLARPAFLRHTPIFSSAPSRETKKCYTKIVPKKVTRFKGSQSLGYAVDSDIPRKRISRTSPVIVAYLTSILSFQLATAPSHENLEPRLKVRKIGVVQPFPDPSIDPSGSVPPSGFDVPVKKKNVNLYHLVFLV